MPKQPSLIGKTFGRLTAISDSERSTPKKKYLVCRCACGGTVTVTKYDLQHGRTISCGCHRKEIISQRRFDAQQTMIGKTFGRLLVIEAGEPNKYGHARSLCRCQCGTIKLVVDTLLKISDTKSCGCLNRELYHTRTRTHGQDVGKRHSPTITTWREMIHRCGNPKAAKYKHYGGRGITVCERWKTFDNFLKDMGHRPANTTLNRIKNELGYFKENCDWATQKQQMRNRRTNRIITVRGVTACLAELCERFNVPYGRVMGRLTKHWTPEDAFFKPLHYRKQC